jgi:hypothetical protein
MNPHLTNNHGLSLAMAVWLAHDEYTNGAEEFEDDDDVMSATSLIKPTRQIVLGSRVPLKEQIVDVMDLFGVRHGHALHNDIENAWTDGHAVAMKRIGYPQKVIDKVRINPADEDLSDEIIPVYLEQRRFRKIKVDGYEIIISGKFDQIIDGELNDTKKTSTYTHTSGNKTDDYRIQGSIYRWLNMEQVTSDTMKIQHIFTDWKRGDSQRITGYPPTPVHEFSVDLWTESETETWIKDKIREVIANQNLDDKDMVRCSDKDLWRSDPKYKYYADPAKASLGGRSTKNFDSYPAAALHASKEGKGVVLTIPGQVKACGYCKAKPICLQTLEYETE